MIVMNVMENDIIISLFFFFFFFGLAFFLCFFFVLFDMKERQKKERRGKLIAFDYSEDEKVVVWRFLNNYELCFRGERL